jgi:hypothetical protein
MSWHGGRAEDDACELSRPSRTSSRIMVARPAQHGARTIVGLIFGFHLILCVNFPNFLAPFAPFSFSLSQLRPHMDLNHRVSTLHNKRT